MKLLTSPILLLYCFFLITTHAIAQEEPPIIKAVAGRDLAKVKSLIDQGADINAENEWRRSALDLAIETNQLEMVKLLISNGASGWKNVQGAAENNNLEMVRYLISQNFDLGYALVYACENNNLEMARVLIDAGSPVNLSQKRKSGLFSKYYVSPIEFAIDNDNKELVFLLLDKGVLLKEAMDEAFSSGKESLIRQLADRDKAYDEYLRQSIHHNMRVLAEHFIAKGANPNQKDEGGNSLTHLAAKNGNEELSRYCIEQLKLDLNAVNYKEETALMLAVESNNTILANYMLSKGANANSFNAQGENTLFYIRENNREMFELLIHNGADLSHSTNNNSTLLINAARSGNFDIVRYLLENGADVNAKNDLGHTAFQYIITPYDRDRELVQLFLSKGADINTRDANYGKSLMYYAIESESASRIRFLLDNGASINTLDNSGDRPSVDDPEIIRLIIEQGADLNVMDDRDDTYLCEAIYEEDLELAHYLVNKGADVNIGCYFTEPPLVKAVEKGNLTLVRFLVENGANVDAEGYFHKNVMEYAKENGNPEIIAYLESQGAMTKTDRSDLYKRSMEMESSLRAAMNTNDQSTLAQLIKKCNDLVIQDRLVRSMAEFAAKNGNLIIVELLTTHLRLELNAPINDQQQTLLIVSTINNQTSLVSYLLQAKVNTNALDVNSKKAQDYSSSKEMKKVYKDAGF